MSDILEDRIVKGIQSLCSADPTLVDSDKEFGAILWRMADGSVEFGSIVRSPSHDEVRLYPVAAICEILASTPNRDYLGDFHAHPVTKTWIGQLPSPDDLFSTSVASDFWERKDGREPIPLSPKAQAILLLRTGDIILVMPSSDRTSYATLAVQRGDLTYRRNCYERWHQAADRRLGVLDPHLSPSEFRDKVRQELVDINRCMSGRSVLTLVPMSSQPSLALSEPETR